MIFIDPEELKYLEPLRAEPPDSALTEAVAGAMQKLPPTLKLIVYHRIYEGMAVSEIAKLTKNSIPETRAMLYEAYRLLRDYLAGFASQRWGIEPEKSCQICAHPQARLIEEMLKTKKNAESWGTFCRRLQQLIGERIHPPNILIAHLRHKNNQDQNIGGIDDGR